MKKKFTFSQAILLLVIFAANAEPRQSAYCKKCNKSLYEKKDYFEALCLCLDKQRLCQLRQEERQEFESS